MNDSGAVRSAEASTGRCEASKNGRLVTSLTAEPVTESLTLDVLHSDESTVFMTANFVDLNYVWVRELSESLSLAFKALLVSFATDTEDSFDGDLPV